MSKKFLHNSSNAVRIQTPTTAQKEHSTPLFLTSSFIFENAETMSAAFAGENDSNIYSRFSNPNAEELVQKMCALENAEAGFATASGMAAIFACIFSLLKQGEHIICCSSVFGSTHTIVSKYLPRFGIEYTFVSAQNQASWEAAIRPNTKMIFLETPTNPQLEIIDLEWIGLLAKQHKIILAVDNCFATPILQQPILYGANLVIHSATKWIDGQGRVLGGVIVGEEKLVHEIYLFCRNTGPALSPFNAWVLSKSLETLEVRMQKHCENAFALAQLLQEHPKINWVKYPFLPTHAQYEIAKKQMKAGGGIVCFELKGGIKAATRFLNSLKMLSLTSNLGDTRSIASHPASTTHSKLSKAEKQAVGITDGFIRISVGLEHIEDISKDILQALEQD